MSLPTVTWRPSPYYNARDARYALRGVVNHRIVGTLASARRVFAGETTRKASTHFGIGYIAGILTIDQYVDLADMAWGNGDVREPSWSRIIPGVNPNLYTVSIEHEDGGEVNRGVVTDEIWRASMELQKLLSTGDPARIRAAGIRVRTDAIARQLAAIPKDATGYIDHNQISGPNKPYCFRRWLDDPGFVEGTPSRRTRLLRVLNAEEDMEVRAIITEKWNTKIGPDAGWFLAAGERKWFTASEEVTSVAELALADGTNARLIAYGSEALVMPRANLDPIPGTRVEGLPAAGDCHEAEDRATRAAESFNALKFQADGLLTQLGQTVEAARQQIKAKTL